MKYKGNHMKTIFTIFLLTLLIGCSKNDSLALMMEASFTEQFSHACNENKKCIEITESYMDVCFNKKLAISAIEANKAEKKKINTKHILEIQNCLTKRANTDYWENIDMPNFILSQVK